MRKAIILLAVAAVATLAVATGLALAVETSGNAKNNVIYGTQGTDTLSGGGGDDRIYGRGARDRIHGDSGGDRLFGNPGPDEVYGDDGFDPKMFGDDGDDYINAADERGGDLVDCGRGDDDRALIDRFRPDFRIATAAALNEDEVRNCEVIYIPIPTTEPEPCPTPPATPPTTTCARAVATAAATAAAYDLSKLTASQLDEALAAGLLIKERK